MTDETDSGEGETDTDGLVRKTIQASADTAEYDFLAIVAELEGKELDELPSLYDEVGHLIETLFQTPPSPESQFEMSFSYAGYRVTISHRGHIKLIPVKQSVEEG